MIVNPIGGGAEINIAQMTKDMFSLNGGKLVISFSKTIPVSRLVSFSASGEFNETSSEFCIGCSRDTEDKLRYSHMLSSRTDQSSGGGSWIIDETQNTISTRNATWDDWWQGSSGDLGLNESYYIYI